MGNDKSDKNNERKKTIRRHTDLEVYRMAFAAAMRIFELTRSFPKEERYAILGMLVDMITHPEEWCFES